jgi:amino acid adenylation domain-containing protein
MDNAITDIAIIGMAGRFPGARNVEELWRNLCAGVESIRHFSSAELDETARAFADEANYVKARAIIDDADKFDAAFFGIYPKEAELIDPQQRIFLECCWHACEDAGYDPHRYAGAVGVYAGCSPNTYFLRNVCAEKSFIGEYTAGYQVSNVAALLGSNFEFLPTRVAYKLNLKGPAFSLNCGCSTSLVAVCQACLSLQNYQCDMALAGGVSITFPQERGYLHEPGGMVSPDGHCRTFDAQAQGTVFGDGAGVVLLKRLEDALTDGDHLYAIIKGFGLSNDGDSKVGFTAPGVDGQERAIAMAHAMAAVDPASITYIEAHGTATPLGDPIEIAALTQSFNRHTKLKQFCAIGSIKTNFGHLDVAAGVAGLIKTALSLHHRTLPPTLNFATPNPVLQLEDSPFYVNTSLTPWKRKGTALRAGVSAFGMGGTNAHVVLEEAPPIVGSKPERRARLLLLSARTEEALDNISADLATYLCNDSQADLTDTAWTLMTGRRAFDVRRILVANDCDDAALSMRDSKRIATRSTRPEHATVAFMFPGQGTQYVGMGQRLCAVDSYFREQMENCLRVLKSVSGIDLTSILIADEARPGISNRIDDTVFAQPALFIIEYALAKFWMHLGILPNAMIGHSVGEFVAACLAGVFSLEDGLRLIAERGRMMQEMPAGAMLSVRLGERQMAEFMRPSLELAAANGPQLVVAAGPNEAIAELEQRLNAAGVVNRRLRTSHAFHSGMMDPVIAPFRELVERVTLNPPAIPFVSSVSGDWITKDEAASPEYWARHLRSTVRFSDGIGRLRAADWALLEVGPGNTLSTLARQHPAAYRDQLVASSLPDRSMNEPDDGAVLHALGQLWTYGINPEWPRLYGDEKPRRVSLPLYPFERKRFWLEAREAQPQAAIASPDSGINALPQAVDGRPQQAPEGQHDGDPVVNMSVDTDRKAQIRSSLEAIFTDLSGMDMSTVPVSASFLEMGFDSLFLTQVSQALQTKFGLKIKFRQLVDQLSDLSSLTDYLDRQLRPDAFRPSTPAPAAQLSTARPPQTLQTSADAVPKAASVETQAPSATMNGTGGGTGDLEELCRLQLRTLSDVMAKQLEMLRDAGHASGLTLSPQPTANASAVAPAIRQTTPASAQAPETEIQGSPRFKPLIQRGSGSDLSPDQQKQLDRLVERYNQRTAGSKEMTQRHRARLADPRAAAGLRPQWKELVYPIVTVRSKGSKLWDVDGNEYIDLVNGYGPIMLGHAPDFVTAAVAEQLRAGYETGPQSPLAGKVAEAICEMTGNERAAFCNTGSEAVTAAFRLARTVTGRNKVVLFSGAYHGMFDEVLVKGVKSAEGPRSMPVAPGIPREKVANVIVLDYGTAESLRYIEAHSDELAAVIVEPVQSRHPGLQPIEFLKHLRAVTERSNTALIFDEVVTGFRVHPGGCQALFGIKADLATYGKVLAGGLPIGVVAGKAAFMDALDGGMWNYGDDSFPETGVTFFAGTFVRHPLALAAAAAVLDHLKQAGPQLQANLTARNNRMVAELNEILKQHGLPVTIESFGSISYFSFPAEYRFASLFYYLMREKGVYVQEGFPFLLTTAHSDDDLAHIARAFEESIIEMQAAGFLPATTADDSLYFTDGAAAKAYVNGLDHQPLTPGQAQQQTESSAAANGITDSDFPARAALTESQLEIWLSASLSGEASCAYNESFTLKLRGKLDHDALLRALDRLIQRHEALRTTFRPDGDFQEFAPELKLQVPTEDFSNLDESRRADRLTELLEAEARVPFNLTAGPLVRVKLIRMGPDEHHVLFTSHHIVCDGWSTNVILDELAKLYNGLSTGSGCELPAPMGFGAYARLQAEHFKSSEGAANEEYWVEQFKQPVAPLDLPLDRPRPAIKSYAGATLRRVIPVETYRRVKQVAAKQKCTLFVALLAGFQALLSRLSGQNDIVVGIPAAGQSLLEDEMLVGHCVNFLPLRGHLDNAPSMGAYLDQVKATLLDAYDHQNYTYGRLVRTLSIQRDPSRLPLMEVQFNLERVGADTNFAGLAVEVDPNPKAFVNHDLFWNVIESDQGLTVDCDYNAHLFDAETIERWLGHYQILLEGMISEVSRPLSRLPLLSAAEVQRIVTEWNDTTLDYSRQQCVHELFEEQVRRTPDAIAAVFKDEQVSYAELDARANQLANHLLECGVARGSLVAICVNRSLNMLAALLGVLKAGCAYVPLDPIYPEERLRFILEETRASVTLTETGLESLLSACPGARVCLDVDWPRIAEQSTGAPLADVRGEDLAYVIYTSGSTGRPKGVEIPHRAYVNLLNAMSLRPGLQAGDVLVAVTTLAFDIAGLELMLPLSVGARVVIASRETAADGAALLAEIKRTGANVLQATPITWRQLLAAGWSGQPGLKMLCGGEALPADLAAGLRATGGQLWNMYGPTETTIWSSTDLVGEEGKVTIGRPISNTQLYILDNFDQPVPIGVAGELYIGGEGLARGYFKWPELTAEKFIASPLPQVTGSRLFRTGDLARYLVDGRIECLGRRDNQVKLRGYRIELGEIESLLAEGGTVQEAALSIDVDVSGEARLIAYVVGKQGQVPNVSELKALLRTRVPEYMVPSAFMIMESLPRTENGKLDRKSLPRVSAEPASRPEEYTAPGSTEEKILCDIWAEVLGVTSVGVNDDVFALGADSLHIFKIAARASKAGLSVDALQIFEQRTVAGLASHLRPVQPENGGEKPASPLRELNGRL